MKYVEQKDDWDCVIACLAMVTDKSYEEVYNEFIPYFNTFGSRDGIDDEAFFEYMGEHGYATLTKRVLYQPSQEVRKVWPVLPFAPVHVVGVMVDGIYHSIVWTEHGLVFDPEDNTKLGLWDYAEVREIIGIWKK